MAEGGGPHAASKFFSKRGTVRALYEDHDSDIGGLIDTVNVAPKVARILLSERPRVTLHELQTVYSLEDLYDLIEIAEVDGYNRRLIWRRQEEEFKRGH